MKNDLISRSALKVALLERSFYPAIVKNVLENAPAIDSAKIVRCKECKYCIHLSDHCKTDVACSKLHTDNITLNFHCGYGEQKINMEEHL